MKIVNKHAKIPKLRDACAGKPFQIPGGVYGLPGGVTYLKVTWASGIKTEPEVTLYDRDTYKTGHGLEQWQMDRYACVNLATGRLYLIGGDVAIEYLNAEVVIS